MTSKELTDFCKALGWDKESENAKLPDWYGIPGIKFIWHNTQSDPEIEYKGRRCSCYLIEDTMWYDYTHDDEGEELPTELCLEEDFDQWMRENAECIYELCEQVLFPEREEI
jgi:hypothetical protein